MKKIILLSTLFLSTIVGFAQKSDTITFSSKPQGIQINKFKISTSTKISELISYLGKPSRIEKVAGVDRHYIYDEIGLAFDGGKSGNVETVTITFNPDGDRKTANGIYKGVAKLDGYLLNENTTSDDIKNSTKLKTITCMGESMCVSKPEKGIMAILIGYNDKKAITQILLGFGQ
jgi:hypothetical protein